MKKTAISICFISTFMTCLILGISCQKENTGTVFLKEKLAGIVQKGPFIEASVSLDELNPALTQTGRSHKTQVTGNRGSFEIRNLTLSSRYAELKANGYYFNEVTGAVSSYHISLHAIADIKDLSVVNINLLTHLEINRVKHLVNNGSSFLEAKETAQQEILSIFGFNPENMEQSEKLDISVKGDNNAILLAISIILQGDRSVRDLTELLAEISTDIEQDGILDDNSIFQKLRSSTLALDLEKIRLNLVGRYMDLDISATIPAFEKYITVFLASTGLAPSAETLEAVNITGTDATLNGTVKANDLNTSVTFEYGTTSGYGSSIPASPDVVTGHTYQPVSASLTGLNPVTVYHFRVKAVNSLATVYGSDYTFMTPGKIPEVNTMAPTSVTTEGATFNGTVNANDLNTTVAFEYGQTEAYGSIADATTEIVAGHSVNNVNAVITELNPGTVYHFRIKAVNLLGTVYGGDMTFKTLGDLPSVISTAVKLIMETSAKLTGIVNTNELSTDVIFEYGESTSYGFAIQADESPVNGIKAHINASISGLKPMPLYHFRIKATNSLGTSYGNDITFTTHLGLPLLFDTDGNAYTAATIGNQVWMAENLRTTKFNDNTLIPLVTSNNTWTHLTTPGYCWYNNNESSYKDVYGALYNWFVLDTIRNDGKSVCPLGWHPPSINEWRELITLIGGEQSSGKLREAGTLHWAPPNSGATNETGFTGVAGGSRDKYGIFGHFGASAFFLTSSVENATANYFYRIEIGEAGGGYIVVNFGQKQEGASIRCIMDE